MLGLGRKVRHGGQNHYCCFGKDQQDIAGRTDHLLVGVDRCLVGDGRFLVGDGCYPTLLPQLLVLAVVPLPRRYVPPYGPPHYSVVRPLEEVPEVEIPVGK